MSEAPSDMFNLSGRVAVVTGGLGQLGRQYVSTLLGAGAKVAVLDIAWDAESMARFPDADASSFMGFQTDIASKASLEAALRAITEKLGTPGILINNAALDSPPGASAADNGPFEDFPESSFDRVMEANVKGVMLCSQVFGSAMACAGKGSIINIGSIYGCVSPNQQVYEYRRERGEQFFKPVAYSVSKSALLNLTRYLATYWAGRGVRVNTLTLAGVYNGQEQAFLDAYCPRVPLGRMANEQEYNGAILFLASDASSYMTGSNMIIDGGYTAW